jgi:hypothetical protein
MMMMMMMMMIIIIIIIIYSASTHYNPLFCYFQQVQYVGRESSVGIATRYRLDGPGGRIPVMATFSATVQTCPGAHPAYCTKDGGSLSRG